MGSLALRKTLRDIESIERRQIEILDAFARAVSSIDSKDDAGFRWAIREAVETLHLTHQSIAEEFGISRPSVTRWINGTNSPHPALRPTIYRWLDAKASELSMSKKERLPVPAA